MIFHEHLFLATHTQNHFDVQRLYELLKFTISVWPLISVTVLPLYKYIVNINKYRVSNL